MTDSNPCTKPEENKSSPEKTKSADIPTIDLDRIECDPDIQSRARLDMKCAVNYAMDIKNRGGKFPPLGVVFDGEKYWLYDGFHRLEAYKTANIEKVEIDITEGTRRDAILKSAKANTAHGLRRTRADKWRAVEKLLKDEEWVKWSDNYIAKLCNVSQPFVRKVRKRFTSNILSAPDEPVVRKTADGREMNVKKIGKTRVSAQSIKKHNSQRTMRHDADEDAQMSNDQDITESLSEGNPNQLSEMIKGVDSSDFDDSTEELDEDPTITENSDGNGSADMEEEDEEGSDEENENLDRPDQAGEISDEVNTQDPSVLEEEMKTLREENEMLKEKLRKLERENEELRRQLDGQSE